MSDPPDADTSHAREKLRLKVAEGNAAGTVIQVDDELVIGRQATGEGTLANDMEISRRHARIARESEGRYMIEDLGSTNGTYVNGRRIETTTVLETGDRIELGATALVVQVGAIPPTPSQGTQVPVSTDAPDAKVPVPADAPAGGPAADPARISLRIELDLEAKRATLALDEDSHEIQLVLEDGRWRVE